MWYLNPELTFQIVIVLCYTPSPAGYHTRAIILVHTSIYYAHVLSIQLILLVPFKVVGKKQNGFSLSRFQKN